jgi:hypothetical protein
MKPTIITFLSVLAAIIFGLANISVYAETLDGKSFIGETGEMGKKSSEEDEIRFENGRFTSVDCEKYGFESGSYTTTVERDKTHFVADTYSNKTGRIIWAGTVNGNKLDATYVWYKKGKYSKPKQIKWFKGTIKK